ncbi:MAG: hypothetical protein K0S20_236 [Patescibacteria group bacterium]|jgi:hypothetical protein|nr:hypothetical protein [Patescibacteria group bacterium]
MRNNLWLAERLQAIRELHFPDIRVKNTILVRFGRSSRTRFGSIIARPTAGYSQPVTFITINSLFKDEIVPDFVIEATLGHEFVHYAHGFHSPLEQKYRFPHKGDIVNKELRARGLGDILARQTTWIKEEYPDFLRKNKLL